jgi:threonine synthase
MAPSSGLVRVACSLCQREVLAGTLGGCPACGGILRPEYSDDAVLQLRAVQPGPGIDRYRCVLPVAGTIPSLGEGDTPLVRSRRLGSSFGLENLFFKNEGRNPSGAFKDRGGATAAALARDAGARGMVTASSGNAAAAIATYAAAAGLRCLILLEPGNPTGKLRQVLAVGAQVLPVQDLFAHGPQSLTKLLTEVATRLDYYLTFIWAPVNPYILEGMKTISYEIAARLPDAPDVVVCPVGGGDMFTGQWRGYLELKRAGLISKLPRMIAVQSESAPPLLQAFRNKADRVTPLPYASSRLSGLNVPFTGDHALGVIRESGGTAAGVTDDEAFAMQARLGREEGVWIEPTSATPLAALPGLLALGELHADERIVCLLSGAGFKDASLAEAETEAVSRRHPAPFDASAIVAQARALG